jgi:carbon storage regulator
MLVISRRPTDQPILIGDNIEVVVVKVIGNTVQLGIKAPREVKILRKEVAGTPPRKQRARRPAKSS